MFKDVDLLAGLGALAYAGVEIAFPLGLVHPGIAGSFAVGALGRWYNRYRKKSAESRADMKAQSIVDTLEPESDPVIHESAEE